jgi:hypothetical protein
MKFNSEQELFDEVVRYAESMKERSVNEYGTCVYRSPCGNKCLVGYLIADEDYNPLMDAGDCGVPVDELAQKGLLPDYLVTYIPLLADLQLVHDGTSSNNFKSELVRGLKSVANEFDLKYNGVL